MTLTIPQPIVIDGVVAVPKVITAVLDANGSIALELPATNDPDLSVTDWAYTVTERFPGGRKPFMIFVEHDAEAIDLAAARAEFGGEQGGAVLVTGSVLLVGEARLLLRRGG